MFSSSSSLLWRTSRGGCGYASRYVYIRYSTIVSHQVMSVISQQQKVAIKFKAQPEPEMESVIGVCPL